MRIYREVQEQHHSFLVSPLYDDDQLHTPAVPAPGGKSPGYPMKQTLGGSLKPVWTLWRRETSLALAMQLDLQPSA
jgi:hypothetical protein